MKLVCPSCGAIHSAEAWLADADARQCLRIVGELPWEISRRVLAYLALFRPDRGGLRWAKALRLITELQERVNFPYIQWHNKPARPNNSLAWGRAMEQVIEAPPKRRPLKSHGYLHAIAYAIADEIDRAEESKNQGLTTRHREQSEPERFSLDIKEIKRIRAENMGRSTDQ